MARLGPLFPFQEVMDGGVVIFKRDLNVVNMVTDTDLNWAQLANSN